MMPFKAVINDIYARDISRKIKATMDNKRLNGQFIGSFAPYGYVKDKVNRNKLVVDETAAEIVRRIFDLYINGASMSRIAEVLNKEGVSSPNEYKKQTSAYSNANAKYNIWRQQTIKSILSNPTYQGDVTQGRSKKISYKSEKIKKMIKEDWIVTKNTHMPIIDGEVFQMVQVMLSKYISGGHETGKLQHLLAGLLFCGDCGMPLTFRRGAKREFMAICSNNSRYGRCKRHHIYEKDLEQAVLEDLRTIVCRGVNSKELIEKLLDGAPKPKVSSVEKDIASIDRRLNEIKGAIKHMYNDRARGILSEEDFDCMLESFISERETLLKRRKNYMSRLDAVTQLPTDYICDIINFNNPNKAILAQLINRIEIFEINNDSVRIGRESKIYYNFPSPS